MPDFFLTTLKTARVVHLWVTESSENQIFKDLGVTSGDLHYMLDNSEWMLHCALEFAKIFKWRNHRKQLQSLFYRLSYGIKTELLPLVEIPNIGRIRARALFDAGYTSIESIIHAPEGDLAIVPGFGKLLASNLKKALTEGTDFVISETDNTEETALLQESLSKYFD